MRYELTIGLRYLFSRKRKKFISFMSLISIAGVAVGVASLITVLAVMDGFGYELRSRIVGQSPHILIEKEGGIDRGSYQDISKKIASIKSVKGDYPFIWGQGVLRFRSRTHGVAIKSIDTKNKTDLSKIKKNLYAGQLKLIDSNIILGKELSIALGAFIGDEIEVVTSLMSKPRKFKVSGIFNSGMYEYDLNLAYISLDNASSLFKTEGIVTGIGVELDRIDAAAHVKKLIRKRLPGEYYVRTWMDLNRNLFAALKLEKIAMFVILILIVIVAALNIISTLTVMVTEKTKDIGILKSIGATQNMIMIIFSTQGLVIGFLGAVTGLLGGLGLSFVLGYFRFPILPETIYYGINYLPVRVNIGDSFIIMASALLISFVASLYPAYQASRLEVVDALRYE